MHYHATEAVMIGWVEEQEGLNAASILMNQLIWMGISIGISLTLSLLIPFPISIVAIIGTFLLLNFYLRRRMIERMSRINDSMMGTGMFSPDDNLWAHEILLHELRNTA